MVTGETNHIIQASFMFSNISMFCDTQTYLKIFVKNKVQFRNFNVTTNYDADLKSKWLDSDRSRY